MHLSSSYVVIILYTTTIQIHYSLTLSLSAPKKGFKDRVGFRMENGLGAYLGRIGLDTRFFDDFMLRDNE